MAFYKNIKINSDLTSSALIFEVTGDSASAPAKVVAVVAAVSREDVEPPTMSNPGLWSSEVQRAKNYK